MVTNQIPRISPREDHVVFRCCIVMVPIIAHYCATRLECHVTLVFLRCPSLGLFRNLRYWMTLALRGTPLEENNSIEHCFTETVNTSLWLYSSSYDMIEIIQKANCPSISFNTPVSANHFWYKSQKHRQGADTKYHSRQQATSLRLVRFLFLLNPRKFEEAWRSPGKYCKTKRTVENSWFPSWTMHKDGQETD